MDEVMFPSELAKLIRPFLHGEREREREEFRSRRIVKNDIVKWRSRCGEAICFLLFCFFLSFDNGKRRGCETEKH